MIDKKEFLLQSIIRAYIENLEPIGSSQLKSMYDLSFSPATIRGYFKKLGEEGYLEQEHISSGRTPTIEALKSYWSEKLQFELPSVNYDNLKSLSSNMGFSVFILQLQSKKLHRVLSVENSYMILEFESFTITVKFTSALYRFLTDMIGLDADDILDVARQVGATQLYDELNRYLQKSEFGMINIKYFLKFAVRYDLSEEVISKFMHGNIMQNLKEGVYFENLLPTGFMGICHKSKIGDENVKLLVVGELSKDYDYFYRGII
ncbi:MAG: heat-shock protein [Arcobacteraceae bacterium]|jgi:heat-inducible transcriptional repressor